MDMLLLTTAETLTEREQELVAAGGITGFVFAAMAFLVPVLLVWAILQIIARWRLFTKAGEPGWKSIIPVYSDYVEWKIGWTNIALFWVTLILGLIALILFNVSGVTAAVAPGADTQAIMATVNMPLTIVGLILACAAGVLSYIADFKLFKAFGKGVGWFVAYILLGSIMLLVLGFGSAQYQGPQD